MYILYVCIYIYMYIYSIYMYIFRGPQISTLTGGWCPWRFSWRKWYQKRKCLSGHWWILNHLRKIPIIQKAQRTPASYKIDFLPMSWQCFPMWKLWISELNSKCPKQNLDIRIISCMEFTKHFEPWQIWNLNRHPLQLAILEAGCLDSETGHPSIEKEGQ